MNVAFAPLIALIVAVCSIALITLPETSTDPPGAYRPSPDPYLTWLDTTEVEVGDIPRSVDYTHAFRFRNESNEPLIVQNVRESCGCTASDWSEAPVMPGDTGTVTMTYDAGATGYFRKWVKVFFYDRRGGHKLYLSGYVE